MFRVRYNKCVGRDMSARKAGRFETYDERASAQGQARSFEEAFFAVCCSGPHGAYPAVKAMLELHRRSVGNRRHADARDFSPRRDVVLLLGKSLLSSLCQTGTFAYVLFEYSNRRATENAISDHVWARLRACDACLLNVFVRESE